MVVRYTRSCAARPDYLSRHGFQSLITVQQRLQVFSSVLWDGKLENLHEKIVKAQKAPASQILEQAKYPRELV